MASSTPIRDLDDLMRAVARALDSAGAAYFVTGGQAAITFGEPRFTNDVDLVARLRVEHLEVFFSALDALSDPGLYFDRQSIRTAVERGDPFNVIHVPSGLKADIMLPKYGAYEQYRFGRRVAERQPDDTEVLFASPEDVILAKLLWFEQSGVEKHVRDVSGIIKMQGDKLDRKYLEEWAYLLDVRDAWRMIVAKVDAAERGGA